MKKSNLLIVIILLLCTAAIAGFHLTGRPTVSEGNLIITYEGKDTIVDPFKAENVAVQGTTVNAKVDTKEISETGVTLMSVLNLPGVDADDYSTAKVVASDEYSAELSADEVNTEGTAYLIRTLDDDKEAIRLIVFGDSDSKRQVKNVMRIELIK